MKRSMIAAAAVLCGLLVCFAATPANAASVAGLTTSTTVDGCTAQVSNPTKTSTASAAVGIVASVQCPAPVSWITLNMAIDHNGRPLAGYTATVPNAAGLGGALTSVCSTGNYIGGARFNIRFGDAGPSIEIDVTSPIVSITC